MYGPPRLPETFDILLTEILLIQRCKRTLPKDNNELKQTTTTAVNKVTPDKATSMNILIHKYTQYRSHH